MQKMLFRIHLFSIYQKNDFETEQHIRAWLIRVAINKAKNKNNTFFRRNTLHLEDLFEEVMKLPNRKDEKNK